MVQEIQEIENNPPATFLKKRLTDEVVTPDVLEEVEFFPRHDSWMSKSSQRAADDHEAALFKDADKELANLRNTVLKYQKKLKLSDKEVCRFQGNLCTWSEVELQIDRAKQRESGTDENASKLRKAFNKIRDALPAFEGWLKLLPNGDYGSAIFGVFSIIVGASVHAREVRLEVIQCLEAIPTQIRHAREYRELYKAASLNKITSQLVNEILRGLGLIIIYMGSGSLKHAMGNMIQGQHYKHDLQEQIERIKIITEDMNTEAVILSQERLRRLEERLSGTDKKISTLLKQRDLQNAFECLGEHISEQVVNSLYVHLASNPRLENEHRGSSLKGPFETDPRSNLITTAVSFDRDDVLDTLVWSSNLSKNDLNHCLSRCKSFSLAEQDRAKWIVRSDRMKDWISKASSRVLLINGNGGADATFSPTSFVAAKILESLNRIEHIVTIHYFCSLHRGSTSNPDAVTSMVKNLIGQLLSLQESDTCDFLDPPSMERIRSNDLEALLIFFSQVIQRLPSKTVLFWIIDGVTDYERFVTRPDFEYVIDALLAIIKSYSHILVKFLLTCSGRSFYINKILSPDDILTVPEHVDGDFQGWSDITSMPVGSTLQGLG